MINDTQPLQSHTSNQGVRSILVVDVASNWLNQTGQALIRQWAYSSTYMMELTVPCICIASNIEFSHVFEKCMACRRGSCNVPEATCLHVALPFVVLQCICHVVLPLSQCLALSWYFATVMFHHAAMLVLTKPLSLSQISNFFSLLQQVCVQSSHGGESSTTVKQV